MSPLQTALSRPPFGELEGILGHKVVIDPEWQLIVAELDKFYEDKTNMIAVITNCVQAWVKSMMELLEDSAHEAWANQVLDKVPVRMQVFVEVAPDAEAATSWSDQQGGFVVTLPKKAVHHPAELFPTFRGNLLSCFEVKKKPQLPAKTAAADREEVMQTSTTAHQLPARSKVEFMPSAASLPRPDLLFLQPPYHLTMTSSHKSVELHCSHSPTLEMIAEYFKRWCRVNHADTRNVSCSKLAAAVESDIQVYLLTFINQPPAAEVVLHQSAFGLGEMFDRLTISTEDTRYTSRFRVTAPMVVSLIEGVLGYQLTSTHGAWIFRRDTEFKTL
ncbi:hypothetical protein N0V88_004314 [Collariella sp. IMI 366227]|nr:hypothetical protein N0V88_004314 [Collariella sp. IMI 366227]